MRFQISKINKISHSQNIVAYCIGGVILILIPALSYFRAFGVPVNITALVFMLMMFTYLISPLRMMPLSQMTGSDTSLLVFLLVCMLPALVAPSKILALPLNYLLHWLSLILVCPLAYVQGKRFIGVVTLNQIIKLYWCAIFMAVIFIVVRFIYPEYLADEGFDVGSYYQYAGDCLALVSLLAYSKGYRTKFGWTYILAAILIVLIGSRASVVAYLLALCLTALMPIILLMCIFGVLFLFTYQDLIFDIFPSLYGLSRVLVTISKSIIGGELDQSFSERGDYVSFAMDVIYRSPFIGEFGYDYFNGLEVGQYAHSAIDIWAQYGFVAFIAFVMTVIIDPLLRVVKSIFLLGYEKSICYWLPLLMFLLVEFAFFRHQENIPLFFCIGCLVKLVNKNENAE